MINQVILEQSDVIDVGSVIHHHFYSFLCERGVVNLVPYGIDDVMYCVRI